MFNKHFYKLKSMKSIGIFYDLFGLTIYYITLYNNPSHVLLRFARNVFSLTCSPFFLNETLKVHLKQFIPIENYSKFIQQLLLNLYVEDLSNSFNNVEDSFKFYEVSKKCLAEASFKLHKWATKIDELVVSKSSGS